MRRSFIKWWRVVLVPVFQPNAQQPVQNPTQDGGVTVQPIQPVQNNMQQAQPVAPEPVAPAAPQATPQAAPVEEEVDLFAKDDLTDDEKAAKEILERLAREAAEDEAKKQAEIDAARAHVENSADSSYNAETKSFSGLYGQGPMDEDTQAKVLEILQQSGRDGLY